MTLEQSLTVYQTAGLRAFFVTGKSRAIDGVWDGVAFDGDDIEIINCQMPYPLLLEQKPTVQALPRVETPSGGFHLYFRCSPRTAPQTLAWDQRPIINTVDYAVTYPTPGYKLVAGKLEAIPVLTVRQREGLFKVCRLFDKTPGMSAAELLAETVATEAEVLADLAAPYAS